MAKLTKAELTALNEASGVSGTSAIPGTSGVNTNEADKKALVEQVYNWQQAEEVHAWDEDALQEDLGAGVSGFTLYGTTEDGTPVEVEFFSPLDEEIGDAGVAYGYKLVRVHPDGFYNLRKYRKRHPKDAETTTIAGNSDGSDSIHG